MSYKETLGRWHKDFLKNIKIFESAGLSATEANNFLIEFLKLSSSTPLPDVMETFKNPDKFENVGVFTEKNDAISKFMMKFLSPIMKNFTVEGVENLDKLLPLTDKFPITLISNHLSHLDAPAIYNLIYNSGPSGKEIADRMVFIAGRLAFEPDFTRLGLYMFGTLLVCSKKDMADNPSQSDLMTKINMRSFRQAQKLQNAGKIICIFPEGTRSRDGRLIEFVDTVYHYVGNRIILPIALEGTDRILPTNGFILNQSRGKLVIGNPVLVGTRLTGQLPEDIEQITIPDGVEQKQFVIDHLALLIGKNLSKHKHGVYRNLYNGDILEPARGSLIRQSKQPEEIITMIGGTHISTAFAAVLANKNVSVRIYDPDEEFTGLSASASRDSRNFPIYKLPPNITFTSNPDLLSDTTLFFNGANAWEMDRIFNPVKAVLNQSEAPVVTIAKGFTDSGSGLISDKLAETFGIRPDRLSIAAGATYAEQIIERKISGIEIASINTDLIPRLLSLLKTGYMFTRPAIHPDDITGVQLGGAIKSIYALIMGMVEGYFQSRDGGKLDNTLFNISNRFFTEMVELGTLMGGKRDTFNGLSGMTDFMQSCFGSSSTNKATGNKIATEGISGLKVTNGIYGLALLGKHSRVNLAEFPILHAAHEVVVMKQDLESSIQRIHLRFSL